MFDLEPIPKKPTPLPPCRLYVILAREAPIGVIFRRGPSKRIQVIHWNTTTDIFTPGQWFHGRIRERQCDLSPDGTKMIYFAEKYSAHSLRDDEYTYSWTAISKPPYLTALALWPCGTSGGGGGLFLSNTEVRLDCSRQPHPAHQPQGLKINTRQSINILDCRLTLEGWHHIQHMQAEFVRSAMQTAFQERIEAGQPIDNEWLQSLNGLDTDSRYVLLAPGIYEKSHPNQDVTLVMMETIVGFEHRYIYSVRDREGREEKLAGTEWADWDQRGRLVFAQKGKILAVAADSISQRPPQELGDLNGNRPEAVEAPEWAKSW